MVVAAAFACLIASAFAASQASSAPQGGTSSVANPSGRKYPARIYETVRIQGKPPVIDGRFDDPAWKEGVWAGDFTQQLPREGAKPSRPTELEILYDDRHIYMAIRAYDDPALVHRCPGRRDDIFGDVVGVCFDSYNSKRWCRGLGNVPLRVEVQVPLSEVELRGVLQGRCSLI